jgi:hypothetical protein
MLQVGLRLVIEGRFAANKSRSATVRKFLHSIYLEIFVPVSSDC